MHLVVHTSCAVVGELVLCWCWCWMYLVVDDRVFDGKHFVSLGLWCFVVVCIVGRLVNEKKFGLFSSSDGKEVDFGR